MVEIWPQHSTTLLKTKLQLNKSTHMQLMIKIANIRRVTVLLKTQREEPLNHQVQLT